MKSKVCIIFIVIIFGLSMGQLAGQEAPGENSEEDSGEPQQTRETPRFRISVIFNMSPLGSLDVEKDSISEDYRNLEYSFASGIDAYYILKKDVEVGLGFQYQFPRRILGAKNDANIYGSISFIPIYLALRFPLQKMDKFNLYTVLRLGYSVFQPNDIFMNRWKISEGKTGDGIYASLGLGVGLELAQYSKWGVFLNFAARYDLHLISIVQDNFYSLNAVGHTLDVELNLDFVF